ncbi:pilus assembly FimT family protein [Azohydromonas lata]|uniref:Prepilin-type N-terminal cleavage/methylation domain-containing protein n=1 Tax=Azohydromonas lata TaxID=45677 RepID=A0ABU5IGF1_9BURK|nr:prepilin-type N-terminal cleavage/methylation domain-containing protein [Azohydromonas lata]MDZ5457023.1 hypothetical protein [Azohydromonas lata]
MNTRLRRSRQGFTLLEAIFTIVLLTALGGFAMAKLATPASLTVSTQAQALADLLRRAQGLAMARAQRMGVSVAVAGGNGRVALACTTGTTPCNTDESLTFSQGVSLAGSAVVFNTLGQPLNAAGTPLAADTSFTLSVTSAGSTATWTVTVAALTGRVSVSP